MNRRRIVAVTAGLSLLTLLVVGVIFGDRIIYLVQAASFQGELLWGRVPLEDARTSGKLSDKQLTRLELVPEIKAFGNQIGLSATQNYDTVNVEWDRTIWNISASDPVAFRNLKWWFPIVGSMPYLGYFQREDADALADELRDEGYDVYIRTAGAYSTLGWFRDPLTPNMLEWSEYNLANTILHELAHATVWVPGSVQFNESFANFVGDESARAYMLDKYGEDSAEVEAMYDRIQDSKDWRAFMRGIYQDLDTVYKDEALDRDAKLTEKAAILDSLEARIDEVGFRDPERFKTYVRKGEWNNARMMQFRTYNRSRDWFRQLYERNDRDLLAFMHDVKRVTDGADDPYRALADAVGADFDKKPEGQK